jgi:uncharacterized protein (TIGR02996 family)
VSDEEALLRAIREQPDDDLPRLAYADWLEERGGEDDLAHAELIRVQVELARLPIDDDRRAELGEREERQRWIQPVVERLGFPRWVTWDTERGFPEMLRPPDSQHAGRLWLAPDAGLAMMGRMIDRLPLRGLSANFSFEAFERVAAWPALARLTCLETTLGHDFPRPGRGFNPGLTALAQSPYAANLTRLCLGRWQYDPETMARLCNSPHLARLSDLGLGGGDEDMLEAIALMCFSSLGQRLERLYLAWVDVAPAVLRAVLGGSSLRELRCGIPDGSDGLGRWLGAPGLARLRVLVLTGEEHGFNVDELPYPRDHRLIPHLSELLASPGLAGLEELSLRGVMLGDLGARALAAAPMARNLVSLSLDLCGLSGDGLRALRPLLAEGRLRELSLGHNVFSREDALDLASWPELRRLHELQLGHFNHVGDDGLAALAASPHRHPHSRFG